MKGHKNAKKLIFVKYLYFLNPITLNRFVFDITMRQISTFSRASETLFWVTVFPATPKTLSLLLLATGIAKTTQMVVVVMLMMMMIMMTMTMMVMMMMINICLRTCKTPDNWKKNWPAITQNIARIANAVQCHSWLSGNKDCHEFRSQDCRLVSQSVTRSPIELFWTAKKEGYLRCGWGE